MGNSRGEAQQGAECLSSQRYVASARIALLLTGSWRLEFWLRGAGRQLLRARIFHASGIDSGGGGGGENVSSICSGGIEKHEEQKRFQIIAFACED